MGEPTASTLEVSRGDDGVVTITLPCKGTTLGGRFGLVRESPMRWFARTSDDVSWCVAFFKVKDSGWSASLRSLPRPGTWEALQRAPRIQSFSDMRTALLVLPVVINHINTRFPHPKDA